METPLNWECLRIKSRLSSGWHSRREGVVEMDLSKDKERGMDTIVRMERAIMNWVGRDYRRRMIRAAIRNAYALFAQQHPQWVAVLFDEHFLTERAAPLWRRYQNEGALPTPLELAVLWGEQVNTSPELKHRHVGEMKLAAACFLALLATELGAPATVHDSASLERLNVYA